MSVYTWKQNDDRTRAIDVLCDQTKVDRDTARHALFVHGWDVNQAVRYLMKQPMTRRNGP